MEKLTIKELKQRKELFLDLFADGKSVIANQFDIPLEQLENKHFVYAYYEYEEYQGDAYLLFIENDKLYEVVGNHCSCYELEGQFEPEEVPIEVLYDRLENKKWNWEHLEVALALPIDEKDAGISTCGYCDSDFPKGTGGNYGEYGEVCANCYIGLS